MRAVFLPTERLIMKGSAQPSASTANSSSRNEISGSASGLLKPKVVVSQEGLNFIQDQKDFAERKKTSVETPVNKLRKTVILSQYTAPDPQVFFRRSSIGPYSELFRTAASQESHSTLMKFLGTDTGKVSVSKPSPILTLPPTAASRAPRHLPISLENLPDLSLVQSNLLSPRSLFRIRSHSNSLEALKARAPEAVRQRLISLFQSKKSTNDESRDASLHKVKTLVEDTIAREQSEQKPSAYITKRTQELSEFVKQQEKVLAIKQKLQQVLSGESQATLSLAQHAHKLLAGVNPEQRTCVKEHLEIQKIQKLQVLRKLRSVEQNDLASRDDNDSGLKKVARHTQRSAEQLNAEFSQLMRGVEDSARPKNLSVRTKTGSKVVFGPNFHNNGFRNLRKMKGYFGGVFSKSEDTDSSQNL